jgi:hypothetical protein
LVLKHCHAPHQVRDSRVTGQSVAKRHSAMRAARDRCASSDSSHTHTTHTRRPWHIPQDLLLLPHHTTRLQRARVRPCLCETSEDEASFWSKSHMNVYKKRLR